MNRREFEFKEGTSNKFWIIELDGASHTVHFGRIGTAGQSQTKSFSSDDEARKSYDKLVAEKLKKGYAEVGSSGGSAASSAASSKTSSAKPAARASKPKSEPAPAKVAAAPAPPPPPAVVDVNVARSLDLTPTDWAWATWRKRVRQQRPEPKPFDLDDCVRRLSAVRVKTYGWEWDWSKAGIAETLTREEAHFWFVAMTSANNQQSPASIAKDLAKQKFTGAVTMKDVTSQFRHARFFDHHLVSALATFFPAEELFDMFMTGPVKARARQRATSWEIAIQEVEFANIIIEGFRRHLVPFLSDQEVQGYRKRLSAQIDPKAQPADFYGAWPTAVYLGALVGCPELRAVVAAIPDGHYGGEEWLDHYHKPQWLVFGLHDPKAVQAEMRRLKLHLRDGEQVRAWLAHTEYAALDFVRDSVLAETNREKATDLLEAFTLVNAPEAAAPMLELKISSKAPAVARHWLESHPGNAIAGLMAAAASRGKLADAALEYLREQKRKGFEKAIRDAAKGAPAEVAQAIRREVIDRVEKVYEPFNAKTSPPWLSKAVENASALKTRLPPWANVAALPPLVADEHRLNEEQMRAVLAALQKSWFDNVHPLIAGLREHGERSSLDAFAWALFDLWAGEGAPSKEKWAFAATGLLGGDAVALKLTPLIRAWPGESQHQRAVTGLECLRAIGTDTALMQLNGIAQKLKFKGLKSRAMELMEAIAGDRGLTRGELEDRIVPDCDLDERGSRALRLRPAPVPVRARAGDEADGAGQGREAARRFAGSQFPGQRRAGERGHCRMEIVEEANPRGDEDPGRAPGTGHGHRPALERQGV